MNVTMRIIRLEIKQRINHKKRGACMCFLFPINRRICSSPDAPSRRKVTAQTKGGPFNAASSAPRC